MKLEKLAITPETRAEMRDFLVHQVQKLPTCIPQTTISEYAEEHRILPSNTPKPGRWYNWRTPYLVEIMDSLGPNSDVQKVAFLKAAQVGATAAMENVVAYYIGQVPAEIMFVSGSADLAKDWAESRMDPAIDSFGLREKIYVPLETNNRSKRQGDRAMKKEFPGGALTLGSAQAAGKLRSKAIMVLLCDEIDAAPLALRTGEGNWLKVVEARTNNFPYRKRILYASTPTLDGQSAIQAQYLRGDQRVFKVACPFCGGYQQLKWGNEKGSYGMRPIREAGLLVGAYYQCEHCREAILDTHKRELLQTGFWEPTTTALDPKTRSYHLNSIYSMPGGITFTQLWQKWEDAQADPEEMVAFVNLYLGKAYKHKGARPKIDQVIELRQNYLQRTIPSDRILFLTGAVDVQKGSKKDKKPARLEVEICGHGENFCTWSIEHLVIEGDVDDPLAGAWADLAEKLKSGYFTYQNGKKHKLFPRNFLIDSGTLTDVVYGFCMHKQYIFPSKGFNLLKRNKSKFGDEVTAQNFVKFRQKRINDDLTLIDISTNFYKSTLYTDLNNTYKNLDNPETSYGFCQFPVDYTDDYFAQLTAEERRVDGSFHSTGKPNEALDLRVMNLCAKDMVLGALLDDAKMSARDSGKTPKEVEKIGVKQVFGLLKEWTSAPR